jgi:ABC-2 type transport system permease protein
MRFMDKAYRNLIREMVTSQFEVRDQSSFLGLIWSFLNPVLMVAVLFAYFRESAGNGVPHYGIYLLLGMIHYTHFSNTTSAGMHALTSMAQLTRHTVLPKETIVIGSVLATSLEFVISMLFCVVLGVFTGIPLTRWITALPFIIVLQIVFALWVSFLLSATRVFIKDLTHLYQVFLRLLFFTTPIFYAVTFLHSPIAVRMLKFNPLAHLIGFSRRSVIEGAAFSWQFFALLCLVHTAALWLAIRWFKRCEPNFAEYV